MLKVAYIAGEEQLPVQKKPKAAKVAGTKKTREEANREISYMYYKQACKKNKARIAAIQEYFPGWMPEFKMK